MFCPQCGATNDDTAASCEACGYDLGKYKQNWDSADARPAENAGGGSTEEAAPPPAVSYQPPADQAQRQAPGYPPGYADGYQQQAYGQGYQPQPGYQQGYQPQGGYPPQGGYGSPYQRPYGPPPYPQQYQPGYYAGGGYGYPAIPTHMGFAITAFILSFFLGGIWPFGIVALVYASQVENKLASGDFAGAQHSSSRAKTWCWVTLGVMFGIWLLAIIAIVVFVVLAGSGAIIY